MLNLNNLLLNVEQSYNKKIGEINLKCQQKSQGSNEKFLQCKEKLQNQFSQYYTKGLDEAYLNENKVNACLKKPSGETQDCIKNLYQETKSSLKLFANNIQNFNKFDSVN